MLLWIDLEMTGLDQRKDKIIEIACILTDVNLTNQIMGPHLIINQPNELLESMDEWCTEHHGNSGLTAAVIKSKTTTRDAELQVLEFVKNHANKPILAGNSVHVDRQFLCKEMPELVECLHYRIVDVSTIKELVKGWYPNVKPFRKKETHRALDDIEESIAELQYYRSKVFIT